MLHLKGEKVGKWTVLHRTENKLFSSYKWLCRCDCGTEREVFGPDLSSKKSMSCGCVGKQKVIEMNETHGLSSHPAYGTWKSMMRRCYDNKHQSFARYGGRGITVCAVWAQSPVIFIKWLVSNDWRKGLQIDRTNNDLGYSPENCRVVLPIINANNRDADRSKTSKYIGVSLIKGKIKKRWRATICNNGKVRWAKYFDSEIEAARERSKELTKFRYKNQDCILIAEFGGTV